MNNVTSVDVLVTGIGFLMILYVILVRRRYIMRIKASNKLITVINPLNKINTSNGIISLDQQRIIKSQEFINWTTEAIAELDNKPSLTDLLIIKNSSQIYYGDLLNCFEWRYKRWLILIRDNFKCCHCLYSSESNHVHHLYYIHDHMPWDISNDGLITLCSNCHRLEHEKTNIPIKAPDKSGILQTIKTVELMCSRCGGHGYLPQYSHVMGGICFKCMGHSYRNETFKKPLELIIAKVHSYNDEEKRRFYRNYILGLKENSIKMIDSSGAVVSRPTNPGSSLNKSENGKRYDLDDLPF